MSRFEEVVKQYKEESQKFVEKYECLIAVQLTQFYQQLGEEELKATFGFEPEIVNRFGVPGLRQGEHPPISKFYNKFSDDLEKLVISHWGDCAPEVSAQLFEMFAALCGFRPDIEKGDLEYEIEMNSQLEYKKIVEHLLKLRGPFGARAYVVANNSKTETCKQQAKIVTMMALLEKITSAYYLNEENPVSPNSKGYSDESPDIDAETDF